MGDRLENRVRKVFELDQDIAEDLEDYSDETKIPQYKIVELALEDFLKNKEVQIIFKCFKCNKKLDLSNTEMVLVSDQYNKVEVISCECGESYELVYSLEDILQNNGNSIL